MTAIHAARRAQVSLGDYVGVVGLGVTGMLVGQVAKLFGASKVFGLNPSTWKFRIAQQLGFDFLISTNDNYIDFVLDHTEGKGVDVVFECSGYAEGVTVAVDIVRRGGKIAIVGLHTNPFAISGEDIFVKELTILGVRNGGGPDLPYEYLRWSKRANLQEATRLVTLGHIKGSPMITHKFKAEQVAEAYNLILRHERYLQILLEW